MVTVRSLRTGIKYKETPIGKIPVDWESASVEDVCNILDGKRVPLNKEQRIKIKGDIPYYGANGVVDYINDYIFDDDLILLAEDGGYFDEHKTRPIAYVIHGKSWVNNHAHVLKAKENAITEWVYYSLVNKDITPFIKGGTRTKLNQYDLRKVMIVLPPITEQKKIAEILGSVENAIEQTDKIIENTKELKKGLMQKLLTCGIGHKKLKKTELGAIPTEWGVKRLSEVADIIDCKHRTPKYSDAGYPVVRPSDVKEGPLVIANCLRTSEEEYAGLIENYKPKIDDIVYSRNASFGVAAIVKTREPFAIGQDVCIIHGMKLKGLYLFYLLNADIVKKQLLKLSAGSTFKRINLTEIRNFLVPLLPEQEQNEIADVLNAVDHDLERERNHRTNLETLKKSLMQVLLTGKVRVQLRQ